MILLRLNVANVCVHVFVCVCVCVMSITHRWTKYNDGGQQPISVSYGMRWWLGVAAPVSLFMGMMG